MNDHSIEIFSTCPQSADVDKNEYLDSIRKVARWSEDCGFKGILIYADNRLVDPWLVSQIIIENTSSLSPLLAVQPVYMHPYAVAKKVTSLGLLYNRRVYLNMVAGGFRNDLIALNDTTPHDQRYDRMNEYITIITRLLKSPKPVTFHGKYYRIDNLCLKPALDESLFPGIFVSGSSEAGMKVAHQTGATAIQYPGPPGEDKEPLNVKSLNYGIRIGIIARNDEDAAWQTGYNRFPDSRVGKIANQLAVKTTDSVWHKNLTDLSSQLKGKKSTYWLHPFENYKTFCPYLVGNYQKVAGEISRYLDTGYRTFILDIPPDREELIHIIRTFEIARQEVTA